MAKLGFKELTLDNWLKPDEIFALYVSMSPDGDMQPLDGSQLAGEILRPKLAETVPDEVQALFEMTRCAMVYGYFFYPIFTLMLEQLFRVAEAAVTNKCKMLAAPKSIDTFEKRIKFLLKKQVITAEEMQAWDNIRQTRNFVSHLEDHQILTPPVAISWVETIADKINALF